VGIAPYMAQDDRDWFSGDFLADSLYWHPLNACIRPTADICPTDPSLALIDVGGRCSLFLCFRIKKPPDGGS